MARLSIFVTLLVSTLVAQAQTKPVPEDDSAPAAFKIEAVANRAGVPPGTRTFAATYGAGDQRAAFLIEFDGKRAKGVSDSGGDLGVDITFSSGRFRHVASSNVGPFLATIAAALEAKAPKVSKAHADVLPFEIAILGTHESRDPGGGFGSERGDWVATKLFLAGGNAGAYLNFNAVSGDAEFSIKDEDYGNTIVEELSKVLW